MNRVAIFWIALLVLLVASVPLHEFSHLWVLQALGGEGQIHWLGLSGITQFGPAVLRPTYWPIDYLWLVGLGPVIVAVITIPFGILFWRKTRKELALPFFIIGGLHGLSGIIEAVQLL